jgi:3-dehydroquinate synthetase
VKTALIGDRELFGLLELETDAIERRDPAIVSEIVRRSVRVKARIVAEDERESGVRATLNLGHTIGHALESQAGFARLSHGEAISLGLVAALRIGQRRGLTPPEVAERSLQLLNALGLPTNLGAEPVGEAAALIGHDKKRRGSTIRFVAARDIGRVDTVDLDVDELRREVSALV